MKDNIKNSEFLDVASPILGDIAQEQLIKVYPYQAEKIEKGVAFIKNNSTSIVSISQAAFSKEDAEFHQLEQDEKGNFYFDLLASVDVSGKLDISSHTSTFGQELKYEHNFTGITDQYYDHRNEAVVFFTIGQPFDETKYLSDEQQVFIADSIIPAQEMTVGSVVEVLQEDVNQETITEISLINIKTIEAGFTNSRILFYQGLQYSDLKTTDAKGNVVPGIEIETDSHSLINYIRGKGKDTNDFSDIDFKVSSNLLPFKSTIMDTQEKVTIFADWFDYDVVMPLFIADKFISTTGESLEVLKTIQLAGAPFIGDDEINLIRDVIAYSYAFATKFNDFPRYTADEAKAIGGSVKPGDLKGEFTIGHTIKHTVLSLAGQDPVKSIDELFKTYELKHPNKEESNEYRAIKQLTAGVSKFIYSTYAIGKGYNSFNQIYLPWYIIPHEGITLSKSSNNFELPLDLRFKLYSEWFDVSTSTIKAKEDINISEVRMIQTDRKLTIPNVPEVLSASNKLPLPGDIDTKSDKDLRYMWYLPISETTEIEKLFLNNPNITVDNDNVDKTIDTEWTNYGSGINTQRQKEALIDKTMKQLYPSTRYTIKDYGHEDFELSSTESYPFRIGGLYRGNIQLDDAMLAPFGVTLADALAFVAGGTKAVNAGSPKWLQDLAHTILAAESTLSVGSFEVSDWGRAFTINEFNGQVIFHATIAGHVTNPAQTSFTLRVKTKRERLTGVVVTVNGKSVTVDTERDTLFDKASFRNFIYNYLNVNKRFASYKLETKFGQTLEKLDELVIASLYADTIKLHLGNRTIEIDTINKDDETVSTQRILFT